MTHRTSIFFFAAALALPVFAQRVDYPTQVQRGPVVDVRSYNAKGNGVADDTAAIQAAVTACPARGCIIQFPVGVFLINGSITHGPNVSFQGSGRGSVAGMTSGGTVDNDGGTVIKNSSTSAYTFVMQPTESGNSITVSTFYKDFWLDAKYGIKWNHDESDGGHAFSSQPNLLGGVIENVYFHGRYCDWGSGTSADCSTHGTGMLVDANRHSATAYSLTTAKTFGVAVNVTRNFNLHIRNSYFNEWGLAVECYGCENTQIVYNRFNGNGRFVHYYSDSNSVNWGNMNTFSYNEAIYNNRRGGVMLEGAGSGYIPFTTIENNYFEGYCTSAVYIQTSRDYNTTIRSNRITLPLNSGIGTVAMCGSGNQPGDPADKTPFLKLDSMYGVSVYDNRAVWSGENPIGPVSFGTTNIDGSNNPNIYRVYGNSTIFDQVTNAITGYAGVLGKSVSEDYSVVRGTDPNPLRHSPGNSQQFSQGIAAFALSANLTPANTRWVLNPAASNPYIVGFFPRDRSTYSYIMRVRGRRYTATSQADSILVKYVGTADTTLFSGALGFSNTSNTETRSVVVTIPSTEALTGRIEVQIGVNFSGTVFEYESIEFEPISPFVPFPSTTYADLPTVQFNQTVYCTDCTRGTVGATCGNGGTGALAVAIRTSTGPDVYTWKCY